MARSSSISVRWRPDRRMERTRGSQGASMQKKTILDTTAANVSPIWSPQRGYLAEITLVATGGAEALAISLWDKKENAETYNRDTYPAVLKTLAKVVEGNPQVRTYEVCNSTSHNIAAQVAVHN